MYCDGDIIRSIDAATSMVAKVPCNLTPGHPPSQVLDNLPLYGFRHGNRLRHGAAVDSRA